MNLREMPDSEFQNLLQASYKYDWDLAVKLEGLESVSQVQIRYGMNLLSFTRTITNPSQQRKKWQKIF